eukprot:CAMPEP_0114231364 /NCGR_PEP_ID=MMETSP0058-20121206/4001_1 /TAXON_ID=36894 /ORGANISM="Pyramimonas parkeae, CCMP726" /LENGTH=349 /DNA_ID=CAMNT_0001342701 /DNA_START=88 /DNA_END=1137 /DNA_ORIENTATION=+
MSGTEETTENASTLGPWNKFLDWLGGMFSSGGSDAYSKEMQEKMGSSLSYNHDEGINYARVTDRLIVGSCLQTAADVDTIHDKEGVATILCLQEDKDMAWWKLDINPIISRAAELEGISHMREPIRDFDPFSVRERCPAVVRNLVTAMHAHDGTAYIHCTAGLGRAPAVALAYMWWMEDFTLEEAYSTLFAVRPCHPQLKSVRAAACDILDGGMQEQQVTIAIKKEGAVADATKVEVAGLNVGWGSRLMLEFNPAKNQYELTTALPTGKFLYKFILTNSTGEETWVHSDSLPTVDDNGNLNNFVELTAKASDPAKVSRRERLMQDNAQLSSNEKAEIRAYLMDDCKQLA